MKKAIILILIIVECFVNTSFSCTSVVISGKFTPDGRPLLWKNRDSDFENNKLMYFTDGKYSYIGLVNSENKTGTELWAGFNSAGLGIINTASYNLNTDDTVQSEENEGVIMKWAMQYCATVDDFQHLLDTLSKPHNLEANFGLIDAKGGACYFEVSNWTYTKFDANDAKIAPMGYIVRTNYSCSGDIHKGAGYERFAIASELFYDASANQAFTPKFIIQDATRCLRHSVTKANLKQAASPNADDVKMVDFKDFIPRNSSVSSIVIQGVKSNESPSLTTFWTVLGFPLCSVVYPVWLNDANELPTLLKADASGNAPLCEKALKLKALCFPLKRGNGDGYLNINALYNFQNTGIMQKTATLENFIFATTTETLEKWRKTKPTTKDIQTFYQNMDSKISADYKTLFGL